MAVGLDNWKRRGAVLFVAWCLLAVVAVAWGVARQQSSLEDRATQAVAEAGLTAEVSFDGRDATISGPDASEARDVVHDLEGVRTVRTVTPPVASGSTTTTTQAAPGTSQPPATSVTTVPTTMPPTASTTVPVTATTAPVPSVARLTAHLENGAMTLSGAIPSPEVAAGIGGIADLIYFPFLTNDLVVDESLPPAPWLAGAPRAIAVLPITGSATLDIVGDQATLTATAPTELRKAQLEGAVSAALGEGTSLISEVEVTGKEAPFFFASAPGDGTVTVTGVMPDQAAIDRIVGAAGQAFGPGNVTSTLEIGENIDTTFSLFRIPLVFIQFAPIPQWQFQIEEDVITGNLRGGATFAVDSAELTPELVALLDVAGGILLRNPTIFLTIEGHTDSTGDAGYNQRLSERRAESAADYLVALGVDPSRMAAVGYGEDRPIADNGTVDGRTQNRRVEFALGPPQGG